MSVAFLDLSDFTRYTRRVGDAEAWRVARDLNECVNSNLGSSVQLIKMLGDGALIVGESAAELDASTRAIVDHWHTSERPALRAVQHRGAVVCSEGDVFGDVVNTGAHLLGRVPAGACISTPAQKEAAS